VRLQYAIVRPALSIRSKTRAGITASITFDSFKVFLLPCLCLVQLHLTRPLCRRVFYVLCGKRERVRKLILPPFRFRVLFLRPFFLGLRGTGDPKVRRLAQSVQQPSDYKHQPVCRLLVLNNAPLRLPQRRFSTTISFSGRPCCIYTSCWRMHASHRPTAIQPLSTAIADTAST
jgi:hypothetical protein